MRKLKQDAKCSAMRAENKNKIKLLLSPKCKKVWYQTHKFYALWISAAWSSQWRESQRKEKALGTWGSVRPGGRKTKRRVLTLVVHVNYLYCYLLWESLRTALPFWSHTLKQELKQHRSCSRVGSSEQANSGLVAKLKIQSTKLWIMVHIKLLRSKTIRENQAKKSSFFIKLNVH